MIDALNATTDLEDSRSFSEPAMAKDCTSVWVVRCKLEDRSLHCWPHFLYLKYKFLESLVYITKFDYLATTNNLHMILSSGTIRISYRIFFCLGEDQNNVFVLHWSTAICGRGVWSMAPLGKKFKTHDIAFLAYRIYLNGSHTPISSCPWIVAAHGALWKK